MVYSLVVHMYAKDDPAIIKKLHNKLIEASRIYSKDKETVSWFVMQSTSDPRAFTIVERYEQESVCDRDAPLLSLRATISGG
jgi:hypothetical protein